MEAADPLMIHGTPEHTSMFACRTCGKECNISAGPGQAVCEACCEDHDYVYMRAFREKRCQHCDHPAPDDWYED